MINSNLNKNKNINKFRYSQTFHCSIHMHSDKVSVASCNIENFFNLSIRAQHYRINSHSIRPPRRPTHHFNVLIKKRIVKTCVQCIFAQCVCTCSY